MLPLRAVAVRSARRLPTAATTLLRSPVAGPSRCVGDYLQRPPLARALHSTRLALKDKRWVNKETDAEGKEEEDKEKKPAVKEDEAKEVEPEAKSEDKAKVKTEESASASSSSSAGASAPSASGSGTPASSSSGSGSKSKSIAKPSIPEIYPQVLALPITRRPLFPGFYKAVTITSPAVIKAIRELIAHGQPYIGAFLLKDSDSDSDVITSMDQVHPVGVFAQITSVFSSADQNRQSEGEDADRPETLTAVLYPHRRIHIDDLVKPGDVPSAPEAEIIADKQKPEAEVASFEKEVPEVPPEVPTSEKPEKKAEANVSSFEKEVPSVEETKESLVEGEEPAPSPPKSQIGFLHPLLPEISLTNVTNLNLEPFKKDSQVVRAIMGEILAVFKEIAQLQPIFREQSESWRSPKTDDSRIIHHVQLCCECV